MKAVILAGGMGTRLAEETEIRPKPMVEIGGQPILWHIMKHYAAHDVREFAIALGYKGEVIKRHFVEYQALSGSLTVEMKTGHVRTHGRSVEDWVVHLVDTGLQSNTGGRVRRLARLLSEETFMLTYGDGVGDVDVKALLAFHRRMGKLATLTAVRPPARYGGIEFDGDLCARFSEKPQAGEGWINGGFMVFEPSIFDYIKGDETGLEGDVLERLAAERQLAVYRHEGFWQCMDTLRDKRYLETLWQQGHAQWKTWAD
jgi:glucose-1-phosphate cytidylyltransferase